MPEHAHPLRDADVDADPLRQFRRWFEDAAGAGVRDPTAAALATTSGEGAPSARMVLVKQMDERGFAFFTNYESRKGRELRENPRAALLFYWDELGRQVRIEGAVERVSREETVDYARSRPRESQLSAMASPQSQVVASREALDVLVSEHRERYAGEAQLPVPEDWGGFRLSPELYEFWQHREDRLHDRLLYTLRESGSGWERVRLAP